MWVTRVMRSLSRATYPRLNDESRLWGGGSQRWVHIGVSIGSRRVPAAWPGALAKLGYHPTTYTLATRERIRATFAPPASAFAALLFIASPSTFAYVPFGILRLCKFALVNLRESCSALGTCTCLLALSR